MVEKIFIFRSDNVYIQLFRYLFVGGFAFVVDFFIFLFFTQYLEIHYLIANIFAFSAGLMSNYLLSLLWVFNNRKLDKKAQEFIVFTIIGVVGLLLSQFLLYLFIDILFLSIIYAKLSTTLITFVWNFTARKVILF